MAFSVLATVIEGTVIEEKRCVEKTWPGWWDDLANKAGAFFRFIHRFSQNRRLGSQSKEWGYLNLSPRAPK